VPSRSRITLRYRAELGLDPPTTVAYLCGNPGMIVAAERLLRGHGLSAHAVSPEHYWPLDEPASEDRRAA